MRTRSFLYSGLAALSLVSLGLFSTVGNAHAQGRTPAPSVTVEFEKTDVRAALRELFKNAQKSYTISPDVQGTITASMSNVDFDTALQNVARQVDATYRVEGGVYMVVPRESAAFQAPPAQAGPQGGFPGGQGGFGGGGFGQLNPRPANDTAAITMDGDYLYVVLHNTVTKIEKKTMKIAGHVSLGGGGGFGGGLGGPRGRGGLGGGGGFGGGGLGGGGGQP